VALRSVDNSSGLDGTSSTTSVDNGSDLDEISSTTSEVRGIGLSCERHPGGANDGIATAKHLSDESMGSLFDTLGSKGLVSACLVSESQTAFSVCSAPSLLLRLLFVAHLSLGQSIIPERGPRAPCWGTHVELAAGKGPEQGQGLEQKHLIRSQAANGPVLIQIPKTSFSVN
jgi:hypothetical protein